MRNLCFAILLCVGVAGCERTESTDVSSPPEQAEPTASTPATKDSVPVYRVRVGSDDSTSHTDESSLLNNIAEAGSPTLTKEDVEKLKNIIPSRSDGTRERLLILTDESASMLRPDTATQPTEQTRLEKVNDKLQSLSDGTPNTRPATQP